MHVFDCPGLASSRPQSFGKDVMFFNESLHIDAITIPLLMGGTFWGRNSEPEGCESKRAGIVCYSFVLRNWSRESACWTHTDLPSWCDWRTGGALDLVALDNLQRVAVENDHNSPVQAD